MAAGLCPACLLEEALPWAEGLAEPAAEHDLAADSAMIQRFGPYELLEEVGRGGMGVIYKARQPGLDRIVALKMLLAGEFADAKTRERLLREAKVAARLSHPGIVTIHDVGEVQGRPYFAMEYVPGPNLAQHCRDNLLPLPTIVRYVEELAQAVHYAHQHGVIHRDLKPANILVTPEDRPKLTDFGLTKSLVDPTQTLESAGSPNFMAPEQADGALGITGTPTDVFGLGAILYYLLTGRPPAMGESLSETLRAVVACEPVAPSRLRPASPPDLDTLTLKCLERDPARRYGSALEVAEELGRWLRHEPLRARPATRTERVAKWMRRHPMVAALSSAVVLSLLGGIATSTWQWRRAEAEAAAAAAATVTARTAEVAARRHAYVAELILASQAAQRGQWHEVRSILRRTQPEPGQTDLRGWEWRYLWQASQIGTSGHFGQSTNKVWSLAVLEDGRTVALGEKEGGFSLWDAVTGREVYRLPMTLNRVRHPFLMGGAPVICRVAVVPGTGWLAYTECRNPSNGWVHLWNVEKREIVRSLALPGIPRHLAVSPDGRRLACSLMWPEMRTQVFAVGDGAQLADLPTKTSSYSMGNTLAFSADSRALSLEDAEAKCLRIVEIDTGRERHRFSLGQSYALSAVFSPDGRWLVTGGGFDLDRPQVAVWDLSTGKRKAELDGPGYALAFAPDGRRLVTGLRVWRVPEFTLERVFDGVDPSFKSTVWLGDGDTLLTEDGEGGALRWQLSSPLPHRRGFMLGKGFSGTEWLPEGQGVLMLRAEGTVEQALAPEFRLAPVPALGTNVASVTWIPDLGRFAVARTNGFLTLHEPGSFAETARFAGPAHPSTHWARWVPRVGVLAVRTTDERLEAWDLQAQRRVWETALLPLRELTIPSPDGVMWQVHADGWLAGYDVVQRRLLRQPLDHDGMHRLALSADGQRLLTTSPEGPKRLVDTRTWKTVDHLRELDVPIPHGGAFWPNEDRIGFPGMHVADRISGRVLLELQPGFAFPSVICVSDDGSLVLVAGDEGRVCLWRAPSWKEIQGLDSKGPSSP